MKLKYIISFFLYAVLCCYAASCVSNAGSETGGEGETDSITVSDFADSLMADSTSFQRAVLRNRRNMNNAEREKTLADPDFWKNDTLNEKQYAILFNYLILNDKEETGNEQITDFIYQYYKADRHFDEFDMYFAQTPNEGILESLTFNILVGWSNEDENISEAAFKRRYKYLTKHGCLKYFKTMEQLEQ